MSTPFYDLASLVVVPSGYKASKVYAQKPLTTDGQLSFTRSTGASRVASNGLIEKVRTNLVRSSGNISTQSTYWTSNQSGSTTQNAAVAPDGTTTAAQITSAGSTYSGVQQGSISVAAVPHTYSCYLKAVSGTPTIRLTFYDGVTFHQGNFVITSEWVRYSFTFTPLAGSFAVYNTCSSVATWLAWGAMLESGDVMTDYIATTSAAVSVGPVANVPRLDYLNSSCPRLLLEPQRTNNFLYSEQFDNAAWTKAGATLPTVTANTSTSPDGYQNADRLQFASIATDALVSQLVAHTSGVQMTISGYVKSNTAGNQTFRLFGDFGTAGARSTTLTATTSWQRFSYTFTPTASGSRSTGILNVSNTASDLLVWGFQVEVGSYATSYIPTLGAAVTRGADAASKTGISSLIGQTEGTVFLEVDYSTLSGLNMFLSIRPNASNKVEVYRDGANIYGEINGSSNFAIFTSKAVGTHKIAFAYKSGSSALYIDGALVNQNTTSFTFSATLADLFINQRSGGTFIEAANYKQALIFKTRLTNAQLAELTAL